MSTVSRAGSARPPVRHGTCRIYICINENTYTCSPVRRRPAKGVSVALALRKHGEGTVYGVVRTAAGNSCTCPDHRARGAECKHIRALQAVGILPAGKPRRKGGGR